MEKMLLNSTRGLLAILGFTFKVKPWASLKHNEAQLLENVAFCKAYAERHEGKWPRKVYAFDTQEDRGAIYWVIEHDPLVLEEGETISGFWAEFEHDRSCGCDSCYGRIEARVKAYQQKKLVAMIEQLPEGKGQ